MIFIVLCHFTGQTDQKPAVEPSSVYRKIVHGSTIPYVRSELRFILQLPAMEGEVSVLLVITVIIGTVLMTSLLACYICVFRQLCCSNDMELDRSYSQRSSKRTYTLRESTNMAEITNITSQQTEIEKV